MILYYKSVEEWANNIDNNTIYRFNVYRRLFTPYEQEQKFTDETIYEDTFSKAAKINSVIVLPDNDVLIGFDMVDEDDESIGEIEYYKLSEIRMSVWEEDNNLQRDEMIIE